jgi:hypothetical protein
VEKRRHRRSGLIEAIRRLGGGAQEKEEEKKNP